MLNDGVIILKPISINDTEFIINLINDIEVQKQAFRNKPTYDFEHINWINKRNINDLDFLIIDIQTQQKMGRITMMNFDYQNQKCEYGISIDCKFRRKGIAKKASKIIIDYVFTNFLINKIYLNVFSTNISAINLYKILGFEKEGTFNKEIYKQGEWKDVIRMALFKYKWLEKIIIYIE